MNGKKDPRFGSTFCATFQVHSLTCRPQENNIMMVLSPLHAEFGDFNSIFEATEATETPNRSSQNFSKLLFCLLIISTSDRVVTISRCNNCYPVPNSMYLAVHAAIGILLHASGRVEEIEKLLRELGDAGGPGLAKDMRTNICDVLSGS
ncbi:hypothetical protein OIDMADRAFT_50940 [Oidiodendron maius Zn]|uniref:Uncharacterized protein n=1 Tax=Oidiodendron maius (strain Zn) TaxID=913774 RepID=A0A0C3HA58_OIDMZ|nr:hypothetical protein OIDMADRAFT_50940 [Oidiodendron maius Zn]